MTSGPAASPATSTADELYYPSADRRLRNLPRLTWTALRLVWQAAPRELVLSFSLQIGASAALAAQVLLAREVLQRLLAHQTSQDFKSVIPYLIFLAVILAVTSIIGVVRVEIQRLLSELVARFSMRRVIRVATSVDLLRFEDPGFHDRLQRATVNASVRPLQMTTGLLNTVSSLLGSLAIGVTLLTIEPLFLAIGLVAVVPVTLASLGVGRALYRFAVEQTPGDRLRAYIQSLLIGKDPAKEIRAYDTDRYLGRRFEDIYEVRIAALRRLIRTRMRQGIVGGLLTATITGGALGLLILFVSDGRTSLAGAGAAAAALILLASQLQGLATGIGGLYESALFIQDFNNFVADEAAPQLDVKPPAEPAPVGRVRAENLTFTYPNRRRPSLTDIDLVIEPGQVVAVVGENGSGKTTLAKLLAGLYQPGQGTISWDGLDLRNLDPSAVRGSVAVLFQDFVKYFFSAADNIGLGRWERSDDAAGVRRAAGRSGAHDFIEDLPMGYDTLLGPEFYGGSDLSGGQWQRMALARAFFRDSQLVILDEPTAALDPKAEAALFDVVRELFAGRSVVLISHRFATVRMVDHIYVLERGRLVEHGSHDELMDRGAKYAEMFNLQASAFGIASWEPAAARPGDR